MWNVQKGYLPEGNEYEEREKAEAEDDYSKFALLKDSESLAATKFLEDLEKENVETSTRSGLPHE